MRIALIHAARLATHFALGILYTCSAFGEAIEAVKQLALGKGLG